MAAINNNCEATGKWIHFKRNLDLEKGKSTKVFDVINTGNFQNVGQVKWYSPFRCYSFFPKADCVFEKQCMVDIIFFINGVMEQRKNQTYTKSK